MPEGQEIHHHALEERKPGGAAAPTTSPNAMMPGATGSPRRSPRLKPDQADLSVLFGVKAWRIRESRDFGRGILAVVPGKRKPGTPPYPAVYR